MYRHANEISRAVLNYLYQKKDGGIRFSKMISDLKISEGDLSKNLFWLEEHHLVKLSTSLPACSTFPQIVMARVTKEGANLAGNPAKLEDRFQLNEPTTPTQVKTYHDVLLIMRDEIEADKNSDAKTRRSALGAIDTLIALPIAGKKFSSK